MSEGSRQMSSLGLLVMRPQVPHNHLLITQAGGHWCIQKKTLEGRGSLATPAKYGQLQQVQQHAATDREGLK